MAKITEWLNVRPGGVAQLNISVKMDLQQPLADALEWLKLNNLTASKSELVAREIIESVERKKQKRGQNDEKVAKGILQDNFNG